MAKDPFEQFAIPNEMRSFAEQSVAQARKAFDGFMEAANQALGQFQGQAQAFAGFTHFRARHIGRGCQQRARIAGQRLEILVCLLMNVFAHN